MNKTVATTPVGYALVGAGSFGQFACQQHRKMAEVRLLAVSDIDAKATAAAARSLQVDAAKSLEDLLKREDVELVYIATPPWTHRALVTKALQAGKHVLCEKPLALTLEDADLLVNLAREKELLLSVNLIMRYDPLCESVKNIIGQQLLGQPLHGFFENYAKDEPLPPDHWFWDRDKSGGIAIEHGVHFFDLFRWWLGTGEVVAAQQVRRPRTTFIEQIHCTLHYPGDVLVNFYHSFTQATRMDRQEMRLVFERGTLRLFEWVPTEIEIDCIATEDQKQAIADLLPQAEVETLASYRGDERQVTSRHKSYEVDGRYLITGGTGMTKPALYGHVLRSLLADQVAAIRDPNHQRRITEENGYNSLHRAITVDQLARKG